MGSGWLQPHGPTACHCPFRLASAWRAHSATRSLRLSPLQPVKRCSLLSAASRQACEVAPGAAMPLDLRPRRPQVPASRPTGSLVKTGAGRNPHPSPPPPCNICRSPISLFLQEQPVLGRRPPSHHRRESCCGGAGRGLGDEGTAPASKAWQRDQILIPCLVVREDGTLQSGTCELGEEMGAGTG